MACQSMPRGTIYCSESSQTVSLFVPPNIPTPKLSGPRQTTPHYVCVKEIEITVHSYQSLARPQPKEILAEEGSAVTVSTLLLHSAVKSLNQGQGITGRAGCAETLAEPTHVAAALRLEDPPASSTYLIFLISLYIPFGAKFQKQCPSFSFSSW